GDLRPRPADPEPSGTRHVRPDRRDPPPAVRGGHPRPQRPRPRRRHQDKHGRLLLRPRRPPLRPLRGDRPPASRRVPPPRRALALPRWLVAPARAPWPWPWPSAKIAVVEFDYVVV